VPVVTAESSTKTETQNQIPLQILSNKNDTVNSGEKSLESESGKVQDPAPPANTYMNNLFSLSSSVMKRAQGTSAAQYLQVRATSLLSFFLLLNAFIINLVDVSHHFLPLNICNLTLRNKSKFRSITLLF
jgi:hypothetical protein